YAFTQWKAPKVGISPEGNANLMPVLDMLNVRYVIFRGEPAAGTRPAFQSPDYWVLTNAAVLPRVFIPRRVEQVTEAALRLQKMSTTQFDPRAVAYLESA